MNFPQDILVAGQPVTAAEKRNDAEILNVRPQLHKTVCWLFVAEAFILQAYIFQIRLYKN